MKPFKRLSPLSFKKQTDDASFQKLQGSMKLLISCLTEITTRMQFPKNQQASMIKSGRVQQKSEESPFNGSQSNTESESVNEFRKQDRFKNVLVKVPKISNNNKQAETLQILNWVGVVCKEVLSVGFLMFRNGELDVNKIKAYCSENILRNLLELAQHYELTKDQIQKINESLRDEIFPYFCLKYPESQQAEVNLSLASELVQTNNTDENSNDLIYKSGIKFKLEKSGNYNTQIMQFINYIIKTPNNVANFKSDQFQQSLTLAQKFTKDMEKIFRKVEVQANVINMKKFDPKNPTAQPHQTVEKSQSQKQKQAYLQKVRSYTSYQIGRKLSENFKEFTQNEINSGNLRLKNSAMMRVVTKWCEELWECFSEEGILGRENQFRMKNGEERFIKKFQVEVLNHLLQRQKMTILKKLQQIQENNYQHQSLFMQKGVSAQLKKFTQAEAKVGQFTTVIYRNYQNYLINYLNLLIHGINQAIYDFQSFIMVELEKNWVLAEYSSRFEYPSVTKEVFQKIMKLVEGAGGGPEALRINFSQYVPQLISFRIGDLLRCKCSSRETQITAMYKQFERISFTNPSLLKIVRVKNRLERGNRDILMNLMYKQQLLVEVQLSIKFEKSKFITCSNQFNHFLYQLRRAEFGPLSEMCSIWVNQDQRSQYYLKFFEKNNSRKKKNKEDKKAQSDEGCCNRQQNLETVRLPFICKICQCFYYHCSFTEKHSFCKKCGKVTCFLCQLESYPTSQIKEILPELKVNDSLSSLTFLTTLPQTGGAILNLKSKIREVKIFKTIQNNNQFMLFENVNSHDKEKEIKVRLIQSFKSEKIPQSFLKENIVYTSPEIEAIVPAITDQMAQEQYFIPKYFKQSQKASKTSVTQIDNNLTEQIFIKNAQINWPAAKKINFSQNKFSNMDILYEKFPNIKLAALSHNKITSISKQCERWKNLHVLYLSFNQVKQIDPNVKHWQELVQLNCYQNQIQFLPEQFCQLGKLVNLELDCNHLKTLPDHLENLKSLEILNLSNNYLEKLPQSFGSLKKLRKFLMHTNYAFSQLPSTFGDLSSLEYFHACGCKIKSLPQNFGNMKKLKYINLKENKLTELCESFGNLESLKQLNAQSNQIQKLPTDLSGLKKLQILNLYRNRIQILPQTLGEVVHLRKLDLSRNKIKHVPDSIRNLLNLKNLFLSSNLLNQFNPNICRCISLKILFLDSNQIQSAIPQQIGELKNLVGLGLDSNRLTDGCLPEALKGMKQLRGIGLSNNNLTFIPPVILEMTWLNQMNCSGNQIKELPKQILNLKQLAYFQINQVISPESKQIKAEVDQICKTNYKAFVEKQAGLMEKQQAEQTL